MNCKTVGDCPLYERIKELEQEVERLKEMWRNGEPLSIDLSNIPHACYKDRYKTALEKIADCGKCINCQEIAETVLRLHIG